MSQIALAANEDDRKALAEMKHLRDPLQIVWLTITCSRVGRVLRSYLLLDVVEGVRRVDSEADEDDVGVWVGQRSQTIVIFLASRIPKS